MAKFDKIWFSTAEAAAYLEVSERTMSWASSTASTRTTWTRSSVKRSWKLLHLLPPNVMSMFKAKGGQV
jgi:hypothetical protein